tara:strand:- start:4849 stop:5583 length:735 start_codon:yes stop_codon:yes gene_type:complete
MKYKKIFILIISVLMILIIPIIISGFNFNSVTFNEDFYKREFLKYNIYNNLKNYDIETINDNVLSYLKSEKNNKLIKNDFFNEREKLHLLDVKNLVQKAFMTYSSSLFLFLLLFILLIILLDFNFKIIIKKLSIILSIGSLLTLLNSFIFFILSNINFDFLFNIFHKTFFSVGTYLFNPAFENIVVLYPKDLFLDFLIKMISNTILLSIIILFFSLALLFIFFKSNPKTFFVNLSTIKIKNRKV